MCISLKKKLKIMSSALIAVALMAFLTPGAYAQPGPGSLKLKIIEQAAMKDIEKKIAIAVGKKPISEVGKTSVKKKLVGMAKPIVKKLIDEAASGKLPDAAAVVDAVMNEILPQADELAADIAKAEADELAATIATTERERNSDVLEPAAEPALITVTETVPMSASESAPSPSTPSNETSADWTVNSTETWIEMINGVKTGGDGKTYTVAVSGGVSVPANNANTFGAVKQITVILEGTGTLSLSGDGNLLSVGAEQTVSVRGALSLKGYGDNTRSVVVVDGGTFRLGGNAMVSGNTINGGDGGGVLVRTGYFLMDGSSSVSSNSATGSGGGVFVYDGEFAMHDNARVSANTANNGGGGVYVESGKVVMTDAAMVSGNTVCLGGGVYVGSAGTFTMQGYTMLSGNTAHRQGGGVYFAGDDFTVKENAMVSGNTAGQQGKEVYFAGKTIVSRDGAKTLGNTTDIDGGVYFAGKAPAPRTVGDNNGR